MGFHNLTTAGGNIYLAGTVNKDGTTLGGHPVAGTTGVAETMFVAKLDSNLTWQWARASVGDTRADGITATWDGALLVTGTFRDHVGIGGPTVSVS